MDCLFYEWSPDFAGHAWKGKFPRLYQPWRLRVIRCSGLEAPKEVPGRTRAVTAYGFHSLRHSFVSFCIGHNIPKAICISVLGADSNIIDQYYTHVGEAAQEQAIRLIGGDGKTVQQRYDQALEYLDSIEEKSGELREMERIMRG